MAGDKHAEGTIIATGALSSRVDEGSVGRESGTDRLPPQLGQPGPVNGGAGTTSSAPKAGSPGGPATARATAANGAAAGPQHAGVIGVLEDTSCTLKERIRSLTGMEAHLEVVAQWRLRPPISGLLAPPLSGESEVLGRCTSYQVGSEPMSWNLSYVDLGRVDPRLAAGLERNQLNLGDVFADSRIKRGEFVFGTESDAGPFAEWLQARLPAGSGTIGTYAWRRYQAAMGGAVAVVVVEALPTRAWAPVLDAARRRGSR